MRLEPRWDEEAEADLQEAAARSLRQAARVVDEVDRLCRIGWSLGHPWSEDPTSMYWPVPPLALIYKVVGDRLYILRVVDARRLRQVP